MGCSSCCGKGTPLLDDANAIAPRSRGSDYTVPDLHSPAALRGNNAWIQDIGIAGACADKKALAWLNWVVQAIWPKVDAALKRLIKDTIEPDLREQMPSPCKGCEFTEFSLGSVAPTLGPVEVYHKRKQEYDGIEIDVGLEWACDANIELKLNALCSVGVDKLTVKGDLCLIFRPLMDSMPIVGGVQVSMLAPPRIDWGFKGLGKFIHLQGIEAIVREVVKQQICKTLVLPNRIFVHWLYGREGEINVTTLSCPQPEGVLRLGVVEARNLDAKDHHLIGKPTSDPYATICIGARSHTTPVKKRTLYPKWLDEGWHDFYLFNPKQPVQIEIYDQDTAPFTNDFIGRLGKTTIRDILQKLDAWHDIYVDSPDGKHPRKSGEIRIVAIPFDIKHLRISRPPEAKGQARAIAFLAIQIHALRGLPMEMATGAKIKLTVAGWDYETHESIYQEAMQDFTYDLKIKEIDPAAQRMAEHMADKGKLPVDEIAKISGLDENSLKKVIKERPSFTTRWNQGFNILLDDPASAKVEMLLMLRGKSAHEDGFSLQQPYAVKSLWPSNTTKKEIQKEMIFEEVLRLEKPLNMSVGPNVPPTKDCSYDLSVRFSLKSLVPHTK